MNLVIVGDIGQKIYHIGDEAMCISAIENIAQRIPEAKFTLLSRNPQETTQNYGYRSIETLQPPHAIIQRQNFLHHIELLLKNPEKILPEEKYISTIFDTIKNSDGLIISGGGNLNSIYGWLLIERVALSLIAKHFAKPVIVCSQTVGPTLLPSEKQHLKQLIYNSNVFALRENSSYKIAKQIAPEYKNFVQTLDDASYMKKSLHKDIPTINQKKYICATFQTPNNVPEIEKFYKQIAYNLDRIAEFAETKILLLPHMSDLNIANQADENSHEKIIKNSTSKMIEILPQSNIEETLRITQNSQMVLTSRYHPNIFAISNNVPVVSINLENYSHARISGALKHWGLEEFCLPVTSLYNEDFQELVKYTWKNKKNIQEFIAQQQEGQKENFNLWWDTICETILNPNHISKTKTFFSKTNKYSEMHSKIYEEIPIENHLSSQIWFNYLTEAQSYLLLKNTEIEELAIIEKENLKTTKNEIEKILNSKTYQLGTKTRNLYYKTKYTFRLKIR